MDILVVEDEKGVANFIRTGLEEEHFSVDLAVDGEEGLSYASRKRYDLIILDVMLPGMNGIELCRRIRQMDIHSPVLMLTARDSVKDKVLGLNSGADDYLTKPFSFDEFLARVNALLRRNKDKITELVFRELRVDTISHRVFVSGKEVAMRPKEYALLLYLMKNKGTAISRSELLEQVWGYDFNPQTNLIEVHIKSIRVKLGAVSDTSFIRSVRGIGYMFEE